MSITKSEYIDFPLTALDIMEVEKSPHGFLSYLVINQLRKIQQEILLEKKPSSENLDEWEETSNVLTRLKNKGARRMIKE
ncbi:MAG: hypothetical protein ACXAEU_16130 [Candidatus Hodarchaeales archaeon]|jgi:hypothetical protein